MYALRHPDDSYRFPDGEHCDNADAVVANFKKRFVDGSGTWLMSNHEATVFIVLVFGRCGRRESPARRHSANPEGGRAV